MKVWLKVQSSNWKLKKPESAFDFAFFYLSCTLPQGIACQMQYKPEFIHLKWHIFDRRGCRTWAFKHKSSTPHAQLYCDTFITPYAQSVLEHTQIKCQALWNQPHSEVRFDPAVTAGGSVKSLASGVNFSMFTHFLCFLLLKLLKLGEIDGVKFQPENPAV